MDLCADLPNCIASSTNNHPFTAIPSSPFNPSTPDASTLSLYAHSPHAPNAVPQNTPVTTPSPALRLSPTSLSPQPSLFPLPSRSRRHPLRRATTTAQYNLSAKWSSLSGYLTSDSSGSSDDSSTSMHSTSHAKKRRLRHEAGSEEESQSDEYMSSTPVAGKRGLKKREAGRGGIAGRSGGLGRAGKRRRGERLEKADMEVIWGEKGQVGGRKGGKGLGGLTKEEARRLVEYLLGQTDWDDAAGYVCGGRVAKVEGRDGGGVDGRPMVEGKEAARISSPEDLKAHWRDMVGSKVVDLYRD